MQPLAWEVKRIYCRNFPLSKEAKYQISLSKKPNTWFVQAATFERQVTEDTVLIPQDHGAKEISVTKMAGQLIPPRGRPSS